jgi:hypothetical protein
MAIVKVKSKMKFFMIWEFLLTLGTGKDRQFRCVIKIPNLKFQIPNFTPKFPGWAKTFRTSNYLLLASQPELTIWQNT